MYMKVNFNNYVARLREARIAWLPQNLHCNLTERHYKQYICKPHKDGQNN